MSNSSSVLWGIKVFWYLWSIALFEYLNIPWVQFSILSCLMIIDFATWVWKQYVLDPKKITSHRAWLGLIKKVSTLMIFLALGLMFKWLNISAIEYIKWIISIFIMAETYSIIQNIYAIRTGKLLPEYDVISTVLKLMWTYIQNLIEKYLNNNK